MRGRDYRHLAPVALGEQRNPGDPGEFYVALKPGVEFFGKPNVAAQPEILAVDPEGGKRAQVSVHVDLVRRNFSLARQANGGATLHSVVTAVDKIAASCDVITKNSPVSCPLTPTEKAGYYILHATAKDKRGNKVGAASSFYVIGEGEVGWGDNDEQRVELVPDRATYEPGQTAHVLVKSPFKSADALVTVERAGIYSRRQISFLVPLPPSTSPSPTTSSQRVRLGAAGEWSHQSRAEREHRARRRGAHLSCGVHDLSINPEARRLNVAVKANKARFLPGDKVEVDVDVHDQKAKASTSEVTLYAVDEGVLSLIGYKTPDPVSVFSAPRPLRVSTIESREALAEIKLGASALALAGLDKGLEGGGGGGEAMRRDFRESVYFNPSLVTDGKGHAHASFKLPDSLTTYRIMAVAVAEDDRFGSAEDADRGQQAADGASRFSARASGWRHHRGWDRSVVQGSREDQSRCDRHRGRTHATVTAQERRGSRYQCFGRGSILLQGGARGQSEGELSRQRGGAGECSRDHASGSHAGRGRSGCALRGYHRELRARSSAISRRCATTWAVSSSRSRRPRWWDSREASSSSSNTLTAVPSSSPVAWSRCCRSVIWPATSSVAAARRRRKW